jgi:hypothetical protein
MLGELDQNLQATIGNKTKRAGISLGCAFRNLAHSRQKVSLYCTTFLDYALVRFSLEELSASLPGSNRVCALVWAAC